MKGIFNSENDFTDLLPEQLEQSLKEPDYLVSLLQTAAFSPIQEQYYNGDFDHITPHDFRKFANGEMKTLERSILQALETFSARISQFRDQHKLNK